MRRLAYLLAAACLAALALAAPAHAAFGLNSLDVTFTDSQGHTVDQAGAHPFAMTTSFRVNGEETAEGGFLPEEAVRDALFTQMEGFTAGPSAVPACSALDFLTLKSVGSQYLSSCPDSAAVGTIANQLANAKGQAPGYSAVYNVEPPPGVTVRLGFWFGSVAVTIDARLGEGSPNLIVAGPTNISQLVEVAGSVFTLWGVPADPAHDPLRGSCIGASGNSLGICEAKVPELPFLTMPRACQGPLQTTYFARSWLGSTATGGVLSHDEAGNPQGMIGCGSLGLDPEITAQPTARAGASPSGMDIALRLRDEGILDPGEEGAKDDKALAASDLKRAEVIFPEGMTLNPSQAEGLATCEKDQLGKETASSEFGAGCPAESKVGTVEVETPLLKDKVLRGSLFVAEPYANPFGSLLAVYMTIKEPALGIGITLAGKVEPDPRSGQLITTFGEAQSPIPQQPVSEFRVHLLEGGRSPLITPARCGDYETKMLLTPTADPTHPRSATSSFQIKSGPGGGPCPPAGPPPFEPGFQAGTLSNGAGAHSPFAMRLTRRDGDQDLTRFAATLPPGVLASLVGVGRCSEAQIAAARARTGPAGGHEELAAPSCPADSKIGTTLAGAGAGAQLTYVPGSLYLAGPYNGAPLSVVSITPGVAGPFDIGTVVVRVALDFDPLNARAKADGSRSDPIPHILRGIPLALRDLRVSVDRPNWIFNPTSCRQSATEAQIFGSGTDFLNPADDAPVAREERFQAADCGSLGFAPDLDLRLKGGTSRGDFPALTATYTPPKRSGEANLRGLSLLFPRSAFIENAHFRTICTRVQFAAKRCPKGAIYGHATVKTPLLEEALEGPVYLRSSSHLLPDAVLALHGIIDVEVPIKIDSSHKRLRASVSAAPDAPVTRAVVRMQGGRKGLFVNSRDLCGRPNRALAHFSAQNDARITRRPSLSAEGCARAHGRRRPR